MNRMNFKSREDNGVTLFRIVLTEKEKLNGPSITHAYKYWQCVRRNKGEKMQARGECLSM